MHTRGITEDNANIRAILVLIDTNNNHRCIFAWSRDNNLLSTTLSNENANAAIINRQLELKESIRTYVEEVKSHRSK